MPAAVAMDALLTSPKPKPEISTALATPSILNGTSSLSATSTTVTMTTPTVTVETRRHPQSTSPSEYVRDAVSALIASMDQLSLVTQSSVSLVADDWSGDAFLAENVEKIVIPDLDDHRAAPGEPVDVRSAELDIHVFALNEGGPQNEQLEGNEEELAAASHFMLPNEEFDGLWESLLYDSKIKSELLNYASTALRFSDAGVDSNLVTSNRVVLLHGPPGTGKTSLCKALAQKLAIRFSDRYSMGQLVEINSHSLFSKWFSESGKLVMKMFKVIEEFLADPDALVFLLIDEVESLTAARKASANGNEPSDAIRVVNALLTQIDAIKRHPNVFILTTSNLSGAIDLAFVDRADIKQYIGPPTRDAIVSIYESSVRELVEKGVVDVEEYNASSPQELSTHLRFYLDPIASASQGFSGRTLRKLPFIAFAIFIRSSARPNLRQFIQAMNQAVQRQTEERQHITA